MWPELDPQLRRDLETLRQTVRRTRLTPTREWPLVFVDDCDELLVVREWADGSVTSYLTSDYSDVLRKRDR
jgi:hypothetical protein